MTWLIFPVWLSDQVGVDEVRKIVVGNTFTTPKNEPDIQVKNSVTTVDRAQEREAAAGGGNKTAIVQGRVSGRTAMGVWLDVRLLEHLERMPADTFRYFRDLPDSSSRIRPRRCRSYAVVTAPKEKLVERCLQSVNPPADLVLLHRSEGSIS